MNYILKIGRIVRCDVKDSFDNVPGTRDSEKATSS